MRLLHHMADKPVFFDLSHTKISRVIHFFYPDHRKRTVHHFLHIIFTDRITQYHHYFIMVHNSTGKADGMTHTLPVYLVYIMHFQFGILAFYIILDLISEITDDENKFSNTSALQLI